MDWLDLGGGTAGDEERVEREVFEKADFEADGDDLAEVCGGVEVFAAIAEIREGEVGRASELKARGDERGVEINNCAELDLQAELYGGGGEGLAVKHPAAAVGKGGGQGGKEAMALFVTEALDV